MGIYLKATFPYSALSLTEENGATPILRHQTKKGANGLPFFVELSKFAAYFFSSFNFAIRAGKTSLKSATIPKWATLKIFASLSLLIATIVFDPKQPAICDMAPERATAISGVLGEDLKDLGWLALSIPAQNPGCFLGIYDKDKIDLLHTIGMV